MKGKFMGRRKKYTKPFEDFFVNIFSAYAYKRGYENTDSYK